MRLYGRCYQFLPSKEMLDAGIFWYKVHLKARVTVFIHNYGVLTTIKTARRTYNSIDLGNIQMLNVEHHVFEMLDFDGTPCVENKTYRYEMKSLR